MRARTLLAWVAVGLIGLTLAAGVTYAATQLSSQRIGLSAEPPSAGQELAPRPAGTTRTTAAPSQSATTGTTATSGRDERGGDAHHGEESGEGVSRHSDWDD